MAMSCLYRRIHPALPLVVLLDTDAKPMCGLQTMAMITGFDPAPWEAESTRTLILHRLGSLKRPILRLLDRNPSTRLTMDGFHEACCRVLALTSDSNYSAALY